ncbi:MAG TPA: Calx-beta domain-containing protein, partial [Acidimicrobiales bacterium]
ILKLDRTRWIGSGFDWTAIPVPGPGSAPRSEDYNVIENAVPNPAVVDLDGDGLKEIVFPSYDGKVHAYWLDKTQHGSWPYTVPPLGLPGDTFRFASEPVVADLDNDGHAEVIFTSWPKKVTGGVGQLHILNYLGQQLQSISLPAPAIGGTLNGGLGAPTLANIDSDPDLEVVVGTIASGVVAYDLPGTANARILWGTGRGSYRRTGQLGQALAIDDVSVTEGNSGSINAVFTVTLGATSGQTVTVGYATADGTAKAGLDYSTTSGTLTFPPGTLTQQVLVPVLGDTIDEPNETFFVNLSGAVNAPIANGQGVGTIVDNDLPPTISVGNATVTEGNAGSTNAAFNVTLSGPSGFPVSVSCSTADGTAVAGADYGALAGSVGFAPGETAKSIGVSVVGDRVNEGDETFVVNLSGAVNATIADGQGVGTINNDDAPGFSIADLEIVEPVSGDRTARFTVTLSPATGGSVEFSTAPVTATPGSDYEPPTAGLLTFAPSGPPQTIDVIIHGDALAEGIETFQVNLANPTGAAIAYGQAIGRIHDPGNYFAVAPCRVLDTRNPSGPYGGPALLAGQSRTFALAGQCGIPASAQAVTVNVAVTQPTAAGNLKLYAAGTPVPPVSALNYSTGQTRANNGVVVLGASGQMAIRCTQASGTAHAILDVTGYFE